MKNRSTYPCYYGTHIDILPTILDVLQINLAKGLEGHSLLPLLETDREKDRFIYCESARGDPKRNKDVIKGLEGKQFAIRSKEWKLIRTPKTTGIHYELYNLKDDPRESNNLSGTNLDIENELKSKLNEFVKEYKRSPYYIEKTGKIIKKEKDKQEKINALKSLGYL